MKTKKKKKKEGLDTVQYWKFNYVLWKHGTKLPFHNACVASVCYPAYSRKTCFWRVST